MIGNNPEAKKIIVSFLEISGYFLGSVGRQFFLGFIFTWKKHLFVLLLYVPSQQLWSLRDGQFT